MKQTFILICIIILSLLILPALPITLDSNNNTSSSSSAADVTPPDDSSNDSSSFSDASNSQDSSSKSEIKPIKTYQIYNHVSKELMELTPLDYIVGVVGAEMPANFEKEAIKAQAIAAHTNVIRSMAAPKQDALLGATISTNPATHQAYISVEEMKSAYGKHFDTYYNKIYQCVEEVIDTMLVYNGEPIVAAFHAMSSGKTEDAQNVWGSPLPYLVPVDSKQEEKLETFTTVTTFSEKDVKQILRTAYPKAKLPLSKKSWIKVGNRSKSDTVLEAKVGNAKVSGAEIRSCFGLKSSSFTVTYKDNNFTFTCKGYGHGVGLSQNGANQLALKGKDYKYILSHYYKGAKLSSIQ